MSNWAMTIATIDQCKSLENRAKRAAGAKVLLLIEHRRDINCAGPLWFSGPAGERSRVNRRPRAEQWIVRRGDAVGQHEWVEIDIARVTGGLGLHRVDGHRPGVDRAP